MIWQGTGNLSRHSIEACIPYLHPCGIRKHFVNGNSIKNVWASMSVAGIPLPEFQTKLYYHPGTILGRSSTQ
jgi:hypothetical protein